MQAMAQRVLGKMRMEGSGEERQDGWPREDSRQFTCDDYDDWLVVSESRREEDEDPKIKREQWYQGRMNRSVAEDHLSKSARFDGTFIVRESDAIPVHREAIYIISVLNNDETHHVEVEKKSNGKYALAYIDGAKTFKSLKKLVEHYRSKTLDLEGGGTTKLKYTLD